MSICPSRGPGRFSETRHVLACRGRGVFVSTSDFSRTPPPPSETAGNTGQGNAGSRGSIGPLRDPTPQAKPATAHAEQDLGVFVAGQPAVFAPPTRPGKTAPDFCGANAGGSRAVSPGDRPAFFDRPGAGGEKRRCISTGRTRGAPHAVYPERPKVSGRRHLPPLVIFAAARAGCPARGFSGREEVSPAPGPGRNALSGVLASPLTADRGAAEPEDLEQTRPPRAGGRTSHRRAARNRCRGCPGVAPSVFRGPGRIARRDRKPLLFKGESEDWGTRIRT